MPGRQIWTSRLDLLICAALNLHVGHSIWNAGLETLNHMCAPSIRVETQHCASYAAGRHALCIIPWSLVMVMIVILSKKLMLQKLCMTQAGLHAILFTACVPSCILCWVYSPHIFSYHIRSALQQGEQQRHAHDCAASLLCTSTSMLASAAYL